MRIYFYLWRKVELHVYMFFPRTVPCCENNENVVHIIFTVVIRKACLNICFNRWRKMEIHIHMFFLKHCHVMRIMIMLSILFSQWLSEKLGSIFVFIYGEKRKYTYTCFSSNTLLL